MRMKWGVRVGVLSDVPPSYGFKSNFSPASLAQWSSPDL